MYLIQRRLKKESNHPSLACVPFAVPSANPPSNPNLAERLEPHTLRIME
jgi:hypothetical protein